MIDRIYAYDKGYRDGFNGRETYDVEFIGECTARMQRAYLDGFADGEKSRAEKYEASR